MIGKPERLRPVREAHGTRRNFIISWNKWDKFTWNFTLKILVYFRNIKCVKFFHENVNISDHSNVYLPNRVPWKDVVSFYFFINFLFFGLKFHHTRTVLSDSYQFFLIFSSIEQRIINLVSVSGSIIVHVVVLFCIVFWMCSFVLMSSVILTSSAVLMNSVLFNCSVVLMSFVNVNCCLDI